MKKKFFCSLKVTEEMSRIRIRRQYGAGSISQSYGSADPDPHQNVTDPQHLFYRHCIMTYCPVLMLGKTVLNLHGVGPRSGDRSGAGSISQRYGSADPDSHQNVTDPQYCPQHWYFTAIA
jgi:hypothetical protein